VALGNLLASTDEPAEDAVAVLQAALEEDEPLVREHAEWALERPREESSRRWAGRARWLGRRCIWKKGLDERVLNIHVVNT
jgi:hypothetical protein